MYDVGQVLYLIINENHVVIPVQVVEQIVRRKIDGEVHSYQVSVPSKGKLTVCDLDELGATVCSSLEEVRETLFNNVKKFIEETIENAAKLSTQSFPENSKLNHETEVKEDGVKVTLEDGTIANVKMNVNPPNVRV